MLNAKSGIADLLQPVGGAGATRRQETAGQDSSGLFGATLKGQMDRTAEDTRPAARKADQAAGSEKRSDAAAEAVPSEAEGQEAAAAATDETSTEVATGAEDEADAGDSPAPLLTLLPQPPVVASETESGLPLEPEAATTADAALPAGTAESGKLLPPALPVASSGTVDAVDAVDEAVANAGDAALTLGAEDAAGTELPRWMHSLAAAGRGREQAVAGRVTQEPLLTAEVDDAPPDGAFLKGLQAVTAQLDSQRGDLGGRPGQGQGAEALFKLAGLNLVKDAAPPPLSMAASTVSAAAAATTAPTTVAAPAPAQTLALDVPMRQAGWDQAFAERVVWMAKQGVQEAQIHLNPRNMGPIEVHVSVQKEQASVAFVAHHAVTREALEAAMPRLRDMLQDSGLNLAQSEVSQHDRQREQTAGFSGGQGQGQRGHAGVMTDEEVRLGETALRGGSALGAVDYYA